MRLGQHGSQHRQPVGGGVICGGLQLSQGRFYAVQAGAQRHRLVRFAQQRQEIDLRAGGQHHLAKRLQRCTRGSQGSGLFRVGRGEQRAGRLQRRSILIQGGRCTLLAGQLRLGGWGEQKRTDHHKQGSEQAQKRARTGTRARAVE